MRSYFLMRAMRVWGLLLASALVLGASGGAGSQFIGTWFDSKGKPLDTRVLSVGRGCDEGWVILNLAWPLGSQSTGTPETLRQFVRDPGAKHIAQDQLEGTFDGDATLPRDAASSGFHRGDWELRLSASDEHYAYLVSMDRTERWPRSKSLFGCA